MLFLNEDDAFDFDMIKHRFFETFAMYDKCTSFPGGGPLRKLDRNPEAYAAMFSLVEDDVMKIDEVMRDVCKTYGPLYVYIVGDYPRGTSGMFATELEAPGTWTPADDEHEWDDEEHDYQEEPRRGFDAVFLTDSANPLDKDGFCVLKSEDIASLDAEQLARKVRDGFARYDATKEIEQDAIN